MTHPGTEIRRLRQNPLARDAGWVLAGQGVNVVLRAGYFILLARLLGVNQYGIFVGAFAFASLAAPFCSLGSGLVFMQYVSADPSLYAAYWGNVLVTTLGSGLLLAGLMSIVGWHILNPASAAVTLLVALGECVFQQIVTAVGQVFQTFEQLRTMAITGVFSSALRLIAVVVLAVWLHRATARQWAAWSLGVSALAAGAGSLIVTARFGLPKFAPRLLVSRMGEGFNFSLASSTQSVYNDIDKTMLSHYGMNVANGIYTMAYRAVDIATIPIIALDAAVLPRFFRQGRSRAESVTGQSFRLARRSAVFGIVIAVCLFAAAPLIPMIIGKGFEQSVTALRWLCLIPAFRGVHQLTGSAITGTGFQRYRTVVQSAAAALNFGMNLWLIPRYGWLGAAWTSLATDGALSVANWIVAGHLPALAAAQEH